MTDTLSELKEVRASINSLRGTIDPEGVGAWCSDTPQAKGMMRALATLDKLIAEHQNPLAFLDSPETVVEVGKSLRVTLGIGVIDAGKAARAALSTIKRLAGV